MKRLLASVCAAALAFAPGLAAAAPPAVDGIATASGISSTTGTLSLTTTGANRLIVVPICWGITGTATGAASVTSPGLTFTKRTGALIPSNWVGMEIWTAPAPTALTSATITVTMSNAVDDAAIGAFGVSGLNSTATPWDANGGLPLTAVSDTVNAQPTLGPISTTQANDMLLGFSCASWTAASNENVTGWTNIYKVHGPGLNSSFAWLSVSYKTVTAPQSSLSIPFDATTATINVRYGDALTADASGGGGSTGARRSLLGVGS